MRKGIIVFVMCIFISCMVSADNSDEIKKYQGQSLRLRQQLAQYQQVCDNIKVELIKIDGKIELLREQDKPKPEESK